MVVLGVYRHRTALCIFFGVDTPIPPYLHDRQVLVEGNNVHRDGCALVVPQGEEEHRVVWNPARELDLRFTQNMLGRNDLGINEGEITEIEKYESEMTEGDKYQGEMTEGEKYQGDMTEGEIHEGDMAHVKYGPGIFSNFLRYSRSS